MVAKKIKVVAFIPARGGSKRLPGKNTKLFNGKPLLYYTLLFALQSKVFDRVIVSTDDAAIAKLAKKFGAEVISRPLTLSTDKSTTAYAALHLMEQLGLQKYSFDILATLQVTNPLRPKKLMKEALSAFLKSEADSLVTVSQNKHKLGTIEKNQFIPVSYTPGQRSQDLRKEYFENGLLYLTRFNTLKEQKDIFGKNSLPLVTNGFYGSIDIDEQSDFEIAEFMYKKYKTLFF
jgi:CMP-N-acetylneuraminic acid synthetase